MRARTRPSYVTVVFVLTAGAAASSCSADPGDDPKVATLADASVSDARPPPSIPSGTPTAAPTSAPTSAPPDGGGRPPAPSDAGAVDAGTRDASVPDSGATLDAGAPPSCPTCALRVRYKAAVTAITSNEMKPHLAITNAGAAAQPLAELTLRYWFTSDGDRPQQWVCDYAGVGCGNVSGVVKKVTPVRATADAYLEVTFTAAAGSVAAGSTTADIQNRVHKDDYSNYDQSNDYSFDAAHAQLADWGRVTLYRGGQLVWGVEPP